MAIKNVNKLHRGKRKIDLTGPEGNAYVLLGVAHEYCRKLCKDWEKINKEMTSGDYENLIKVFDREFGAYVDLYR